MKPQPEGPRLKILVIRRDNIGDLVCTTPIFRALRTQHPSAEICALVNSYNAAVLQNNADIDEIFAYTKAKHRPAGAGALGVYWERVKLLVHLRRKRFDYVILAGTSFLPKALRLARWVDPKHIIGFTEAERRGTHDIDMGVPNEVPHPMHHVENVFRLLRPLGVEGPPPPMRMVPSAADVARAREKLAAVRLTETTRVIAIHISTRKPSQRWPAERFIKLIKTLHERYDAAFCLFWAPGDATNVHHPGDDEKAKAILAHLEGLPIVGCPTENLHQLIGGLAATDMMICSDGGAMHIGAALGLPIVCFFGQSDARHWYPWGVSHELLQPQTHDVMDIPVFDAFEAFARLCDKGGMPPKNVTGPM
ncbi:MAG: glycosyltransferase family 9 protein [Betaproteobacteria bacterium]|nr:glycosyltransferase family 9 protein [Betaproteobacteria bacterium]